MEQIKQHYPRELAYTFQRNGLTLNIHHMLQREIQDSGYSSFVGSDYLQTCDVHDTYKTPHCDIHVVSPLQDVPPRLLMLRVARRVECLIRIFNMNRHFTFWLLPTRQLRKFPRRADVDIAPEHINGGFTYAQPNAHTIFVFRKEEFPKVFLHETLHHAPLDKHANWSKENLQRIYAYFRVDTSGCNQAMQCHRTDLRPNEAWVEAWAEIYHMLFLQYEYHLPWSFLWNAEREWACVQAKRILMHQKAQRDGRWREKTHAFSYMVLRAALLWNAPRMMDHRTKSNTDTDLAQLMITCYEDPSFQASLQRTHIPRHACFRMTIFGDL
jgi:hypothetical protein